MKNQIILIFAILLAFCAPVKAQRYIKTFNSADDAWRANLKDVNTNLFIAYRTSTNDFGGGQFWYDPTSTTATNLGTVWGNKYGGRIFRVWNGEPIPISWFGAIPTKVVGGTNYPAGTFDNAPKINAAINWARTPTHGPTDVRASVFVPAGDWWISTPITNRYRVDVLGLGCVFSDSDVPSHTGAGTSGLVSGASRIFLATGANCPMMVWDISDGYQRYTFASTEDSIGGFTSTITIASPGVITATEHGLTVGRRVGFSTTGTLPTGISASTIYYVVSVPTADTFTISVTSGGSAINTSGSQSGTHYLIKDPSPRYVAGNTIRGINFYGNGPNQTRKDCHILKIEYAWNVVIDNCYLGRPSGYYIWAYECNTLDILNSYGNGSSDYETKGVFLFSNADGMMSHCKFGGASGPGLWLAGNFAWQQQYIGNFLYNNFDGRFAVSGMSGNEVTFTTDHDFETGDPIEFTSLYGGTIPTLVRYPSVALDSHIFWAIKTASNKIKVAYSYQDALSESALSLTGGSGTYYVWRGPAAGAYLSGGANNNVFIGNRCDQNQNFGIALNKATENSVTANTLNLNGFATLTATADTNTSAGLYLRNGSANNVIVGNTMMDWGTAYAQTYGVWIDANNGRNYLGQNSYKTSTAQVDTLVSTTGNTTETSVVNTPTVTAVMQSASGITVRADATGSPITMERSDTAGQWKFELSSNTNNFRLKNSYVGNTAWNISSSTSESSLTLGSTASPLAPRPSFIYGEQASTLSGTNTAAGDFYMVTGSGTGSSTSGGKFRFLTPIVGSSGTTVQTFTEKFAIMRDGGVIVHPLSAAPVNGMGNGTVYSDSTDNFFYGRVNNAWHTLSNPNKTGVSTISVDASATFTFFPLSSRWVQILSVPITATRTVTLSTTAAQQGTEATFIRSAASTGASDWSIGGLINLTPGTWATAVYDGSAWVLGPYYTGGGGGGGGSGANPTASVGLTAVNGSASTFLRSDGAPALDVSIAPTWTGAHTFSKNGALSLPTFSVTGTPITGGTATTTKPLALIETAGATSTAWSTSGTMLGVNAPSGFAGRMLDIHLNGVSYMSLSSGATLSLAGSLSSSGNVVGGAAQNLSWFGRSEMLSPSDGVVLLQNAANSDFTRLQLGGTTTSFPAIERSGTGVVIKLADGSANAPLTASTVTASTFTGALVGNASTATALTSTLGIAAGGTGATTASGAMDALSVAETTVASATTTDLGAVASDKVSITGTTTITSFGTAAAGIDREGRFTGALTLTHNATSLIIPGGASLSTAAGDRFGAYSLGSGNWVVKWYTKADGTAVVGGGGGGSVASDTIWDASGDLAVGTGANTAARLAPPSYANSTLFYGPDGVEWVSPATHYILQEDFNINGSFAGRLTPVNSGGVAQDGNSEAGAYGVWSSSTSTGASASTYTYVGSANALAFGLNRTVITWRCKLSNLSGDSSQTYTAKVGFFDAATPVDGAWFEYTDTVNSGNWQVKVSKASSVTTTNTSTAAGTSYTIFTIDANAAGTEVKFYINGTLVHTETGANIPTGTARAMPMYGIVKSAGTTARIFYADYLHIYAKY